ncbi:hypothetical protein COLO4_01288 [Corchorus olitorius]|uniref:Uncharacterized protein n=1 Tax=Corchorus olitorius TaxID=93759 RepID=A0A1R3L2V8_9ROSI|nr:hypothetical protein COLO4_01288 [Corchorus olitorius]
MPREIAQQARRIDTGRAAQSLFAQEYRVRDHPGQIRQKRVGAPVVLAEIAGSGLEPVIRQTARPCLGCGYSGALPGDVQHQRLRQIPALPPVRPRRPAQVGFLVIEEIALVEAQPFPQQGRANGKAGSTDPVHDRRLPVHAARDGMAGQQPGREARPQTALDLSEDRRKTERERPEIAVRLQQSRADDTRTRRACHKARQFPRRARHHAGVGVEQPDQSGRLRLRERKVDADIVARTKAAIDGRAMHLGPMPVVPRDRCLDHVGRTVARSVVDHEGADPHALPGLGSQRLQAGHDQRSRAVVDDDHVDHVEQSGSDHSAATPMVSNGAGSMFASAESSASWNSGASLSTYGSCKLLLCPPGMSTMTISSRTRLPQPRA